MIVYIAIGFVYFQQGAQQREFEDQVVKLSAVVAKSLPPITELQAEYDNVTLVALAPMTDSDAIALLVSIAEKSGIDISESAGKFSVPTATRSQKKVGGGNYQILSFNGISVSGNYTNVMDFISDLDSGETLATMVLKRVEISQMELAGETSATVDVDIYTKP